MRTRGNRILPHHVLVAGAALLLFRPPAAAAAGDGVQLGPLEVRPALAVTETWDDNVFRTSDDPQEDWITTISPSLGLALPMRRFRLEVEGRADFVSFSDSSDEDSTNWGVGASLGADFPGGLSFEVSDTYRSEYLTANQEYGPGEESTTNTLAAKVGFAVRDALRFEIGGRRTTRGFDLSSDRERTEDGVDADVFWRLRPRLAAVVGAGWSRYEYESNAAQDGSGFRATAGVTWDVTAKSTGEVRAGYGWKRYEDEAEELGTEEASSFVVSGKLDHRFTRRTSASLELARSFEESDFPGNPHLTSTSVAAALAQRFTRKVWGRVGGRFVRGEYPNETTYTNPYDPDPEIVSGERTDNTLIGTIALGYDLFERLALELGYTGERRTSTFETFEYRDTRISLSARAAF